MRRPSAAAFLAGLAAAALAALALGIALGAAPLTPRELLRQRGTPYAELGLGDPKWTDDELIGFMIAHPILIERPIVVTEKGARLCRPMEKVLEILP